MSRQDRNKYYLKLKEFNSISQPYRSSLSYIKGRSDFQPKGLKREKEKEGLKREKEREREREREREKYFTLLPSSGIGHSIDVSDNIYGCLCEFFLEMLF